jgi:hypothetical protein
MSKPDTLSKMKYNRAAYRRYEFNLRIDSKLNALVEGYKSTSENSLSSLLKELLCKHFGIALNEADDLFPQYHFGPKGEHLLNQTLSDYFPIGCSEKNPH